MSDFAGTRVSLAGVGALTATATAAKTGSTVTCTVGGTEITVEVARDLTVAAGDILLVLRQGAAWWAVQRLYTAPPTPPEDNAVAPDPKPAVVTGSLVVSPVETRSYRGGWRTDTTDVRQGQYGGWGNHTGCAFYGAKPRSLAGSTVTAATIKVRRISGGVFAATGTTLRLVTQAYKPLGAPTLGSSTAGPALAVGKTDGSFDIPTAWAQAMVDATAGGLAVYDAGGSPYVVFAGRGDWSPAWTMTITWRR